MIDLTDIKADKYNEPLDEKILNNKVLIDKIIKEYNIDLVALEDIQLQGQKGVENFKNLAYLQGIIKNYLYDSNIDYVIFSSNIWRSILKINGGRQDRKKKKEKAIKYVKDTYDIIATEDECDSICIGTATLKKIKDKRLKVHSDIYGENVEDEFIEKTFEEIIKMNNKDKNTYLNKLTKDKLLELCNDNYIEIKKSWSKNKIIDKINLSIKIDK